MILSTKLFERIRKVAILVRDGVINKGCIKEILDEEIVVYKCGNIIRIDIKEKKETESQEMPF